MKTIKLLGLNFALVLSGLCSAANIVSNEPLQNQKCASVTTTANIPELKPSN